MKHKHFFEKISVPVGLLLFIALIVGVARYGKEVPLQTQNPDLSGNSSSLVRPITQNLSNEYSEVIVEYPQFTDETLNTFIRDQFVSSFIQNADENKKLNEENFKARQATDPSSAHPVPTEDEKGYYHVSFKILPTEPSLVSMNFFEEGYSGGAHPYHTSRSVVYNLNTHASLSFDEILHATGMTFEELQALVRGRLVSQINDQLRADNDTGTTPHDIDATLLAMIKEGTQTADDFKNVTFENKNVVFHFQEYQVAPYVYGPQDVDVPRVN